MKKRSIYLLAILGTLIAGCTDGVSSSASMSSMDQLIIINSNNYDDFFNIELSVTSKDKTNVTPITTLWKSVEFTMTIEGALSIYYFYKDIVLVFELLVDVPFPNANAITEITVRPNLAGNATVVSSTIYRDTNDELISFRAIENLINPTYTIKSASGRVSQTLA